MEENISRFVTAIIAIFLMFIFPVYISYEKKDDISYALALRYTQDFVDNVRRKGYITKELYQDYASNLLVTGNTYNIELEHEYVRYDGDYVDKTGSATRNVELFENDHIINILDNGQVYTLNVDDNFNVKITNTNITLATIIYNIVTVNTSNSNVRIHVDYGGKVLAEKWYQDNLQYSQYGGIVEEDGFNFNLTIADIDVNKEIDDDYIINDDYNPEYILSNVVKVGDYVEYYPDGLNKVTRGSISHYDTKPINSGSMTLTRKDNIYWRVLSIDYENNKVTLISDNAASSVFRLSTKSGSFSTSTKTAYIGYINEICSLMFSNSMFGNARSVTKEEINAITVDSLKYTGYNYVLPSYKIFFKNSSNRMMLEYAGIHGKSSDDENEMNVSASLRPVVELNSNIMINYHKEGCQDAGSSCGTKGNPWELLLTNSSMSTIGDVAQVGDYVEYIPDSSGGITISKDVSGTNSDQTILQVDNMNWRVIGKQNGKVILVSTDPIGNLRVQGFSAFNNGVDILHNICSELYSKEGYATARSITLEDFKKFLTFETTTRFKYIYYELESGEKYPSRLDSIDYVGNNSAKVVEWQGKALGEYINKSVEAKTLGNGNSKIIMITDFAERDWLNGGIEGNVYWRYTTSNDEQKTINSILNLNSAGSKDTCWIANVCIYRYGKSNNYNIEYALLYKTTSNYFNASDQKTDGIRCIVELDDDVYVNTSYGLTYDGSSAAKAIRLQY